MCYAWVGLDVLPRATRSHINENMLNELVEAMQTKSYKGGEYSVKRFYQATAAAYFSIEVALNKSLRLSRVGSEIWRVIRCCR